MVRKFLSTATLIALAASSTPALAQFAPSSNPDPAPMPVQFLVGIALMAAAGAVIVWQAAALAYEWLAQGRERRRAAWFSR